MPNPIRRRRPASPYAKAVLGVRVRTGDTPPRELKPTIPRQRLMEGIERGEVKAGVGSYRGGYRWHHGGNSETVTNRVRELKAAGWARDGEHHVELTEAGREALAEATKESE